MPEVSVVIPTYNSAHYVCSAIESVLAQDYTDLEVLVIDDGSTDDTQDVLKRYGPPVRVIRQANAGVAAARNHGIELSRGRFVGFLDADDTWFPNKLSRQLADLADRPGYKACFSAFVVVSDDLTPLGINCSTFSDVGLEDLLTCGNVIGSICTVLCERDLLLQTGGFDRTLSQCADWDMWVRLAAHTRFAYMKEPLVTYRQHGNNMSRNIPLLESDSFQVLNKGFSMPGLTPVLQARRRAAMGRNYMVLAGSYFHARRYTDFLRCAGNSILTDPRQVSYLIGYPLRWFRRRKVLNGAKTN